MGELERKLMERAIKRHKKIFPCSRTGTFETCFTREPDRVLFWYNTPDRSTHIISTKITNDKRRMKLKTA